MTALSNASIFQQNVDQPIVRARVNVGLANLPLQFRQIRDQVMAELESVADGGAFILGAKVAAFERAFAEYVGAKHCVGVNSGTSALHLALICAGVRPGDEVITTPMTFIATAWAISYIGATPVFVDVDPETALIDPARVEQAITARTAAILPVHLYGQVADMDALQSISRCHGIPLIEDAAQAHGAEYGGRRAGTFGQSACFSFYPGKNLGAYGEAGAIVTNDDAVAARCRSLRDHAQAQRYHHDEIGFNYRMDGFQGAVLGLKLRLLEEWTQTRRELAERYQAALADLPIRLPTEAASRRHVWHLFVTRHPERDRLRSQLDLLGIQTGLHYPVPLHLQQAYAHLGYRRGDFPVAEQVANECLSLPLYPEMSSSQFDAVVQAVMQVLA